MQNAAMEEERRTLRQRCVDADRLARDAESTNLRLTGDLSSARGRLSAAETRLERLELDSTTGTERRAELEARNAALSADCDRLRAKAARTGEELRSTAAERAALERTVDELRRRCNEQSTELERLKAGWAEADRCRVAAEAELERQTDRVRQMTDELEELTR